MSSELINDCKRTSLDVTSNEAESYARMPTSKRWNLGWEVKRISDASILIKLGEDERKWNCGVMD